MNEARLFIYFTKGFSGWINPLQCPAKSLHLISDWLQSDQTAGLCLISERAQSHCSAAKPTTKQEKKQHLIFVQTVWSGFYRNSCTFVPKTCVSYRLSWVEMSDVCDICGDIWPWEEPASVATTFSILPPLSRVSVMFPLGNCQVSTLPHDCAATETDWDHFMAGESLHVPRVSNIGHSAYWVFFHNLLISWFTEFGFSLAVGHNH